MIYFMIYFMIYCTGGEKQYAIHSIISIIDKVPLQIRDKKIKLK